MGKWERKDATPYNAYGVCSGEDKLCMKIGILINRNTERAEIALQCERSVRGAHTYALSHSRSLSLSQPLSTSLSLSISQPLSVSLSLFLSPCPSLPLCALFSPRIHLYGWEQTARILKSTGHCECTEKDSRTGKYGWHFWRAQYQQQNIIIIW